ncbi:neural cell adhesion molecule 2 [Cephus cinctus]|uniref:Neural cell adhesion molecule 2 n=1 Tax=Cephus cinctus TaxID=211228 RepID=A0AAJ7BT15_CEPCN|nr:neural cell adhesion molecule 2 [Cephus cinctus]XP_015593702.1 neural cell adhesion molecule 2 [Cephus cinctus]XP_015593710.1 neural cell adhesion molecule 2 [Cephus cinctus]XP_024940058.1 neural cell adhesion molecule 2 [Cephus cinctus]XP_024940070.1 neural cell adhesion molecule 2 [Cephus cinctus]XP_024940074.1 neural cell adhesion molecule 2 [Cephus cinctus]
MFTVLLIILASQSVHRSTEAVLQRRHLANNQIERDCLTFPEPIKEVLAQTGGTAVLPCKLTEPSVGIVTWIRRKDRQLLTVGSTTHSPDARFVVRPSSSDWSLLIKKVKKQDAGLYECQIPTVPIQHQFICLKITEAYSVIPGAPDLYVKQGSSLRLECQLMAATEPPIYVFWYRHGRMINYDDESGVTVKATKNGSTLLVEKTKSNHGGNYTCSPSNARPVSVMIHVIEEEEKPAAMQGGGDLRSSAIKFSSNLGLTFIMLLVVHTVQKYLNIFILRYT